MGVGSLRDLVLPGTRTPTKITFDEPLYTNSDSNTAKPQLELCTNFVEEKYECIYGRRAVPSFGISNPGVGAGVMGYYEGGAGNLSRGDSGVLAGVAFADSLLTGSWVNELLKSKDAVLLPSMIFDVKLLEPIRIWVSLKPPEEKPKEDDEKKK